MIPLYPHTLVIFFSMFVHLTLTDLALNFSLFLPKVEIFRWFLLRLATSSCFLFRMFSLIRFSVSRLLILDSLRRVSFFSWASSRFLRRSDSLQNGGKEFLFWLSPILRTL